MSDQAASALENPHFLANPDKPRVQLKKISYTHDALIDLIIAHPELNQQQLAAHFDYTGPWVSQILATDAFQARMAARKDEIVDPIIKATVDERMKGLILASMHKLQEKLAGNPSDDLTLGIFAAATKAMGYGARQVGAQIQNNFVVNVPLKANSSSEWAERHNPAGGSREIKAPLGIAQHGVTIDVNSASVAMEPAPIPRPAAPSIRADILTAEV